MSVGGSTAAPNPWRETVRDLYDELHSAEDGLFAGSPLAKRLIDLIDARHSDYFCETFGRG